MEHLPIIDTFINLIGMILIPIAIVHLTKRVQDKEQNRNDKMQIFKVLMTNRNLGWSIDSVHALNMIDIVFCDSPEVRNAWKSYYETLCIQNPTSEQHIDIQNAQYNLLNSIAADLGYKEHILWDAVQKPYIPQGMLNSISQQAQFQSGQIQLMEYLLRQTNSVVEQHANSNQHTNNQ